jgi:hypothetical protein
MATCYRCGEEIEFFHDGFRAIPVHPSGSCGGLSGWYDSGSVFRSTSEGAMFEFPFTTYPSYVNPNARCPVCGAQVYFYQSPYGGRVFFDELGPPWPKHPCTDNPVVRQSFSSRDGRASFLLALSQTDGQETPTPPGEQNIAFKETRREAPPWAQAGWIPFVVTNILRRPIGIEAEGTLLISSEGRNAALRIVQKAYDATFAIESGETSFRFSLVQNANVILTALNEAPVLLKPDPDLSRLVLSTIRVTPDGEVERISCVVSGISVG